MEGSATLNLLNGKASKSYQWTIATLLVIVGLMSGMLIQDERFLGNVRSNKERIEQITKEAERDRAAVQSMIMTLNSKVDLLTAAFTNYQIQEAKQRK